MIGGIEITQKLNVEMLAVVCDYLPNLKKSILLW